MSPVQTTISAFAAALSTQLDRVGDPPDWVLAAWGAHDATAPHKMHITRRRLTRWRAGLSLPTTAQIAALGQVITDTDHQREPFPAARLLGSSTGYPEVTPAVSAQLMSERLTSVAAARKLRSVETGEVRRLAVVTLAQRVRDTYSVPLSLRTMHRLMRGDATPRLDTLAALAAVLDTHPAWLAGLSDDEREGR